MAFHETAIFPTDISYGSTGGAGYSTIITKLDSGHEIRSARWAQAKHRYDAGYGVKSLDQLKTVLEFYHARLGTAHGFRWKDQMDFSTDSTRRGTADWDDVNLGQKNSSNQVQLQTHYTSGGVTVKRNIEKPISGTIKVGWNGAEKTEGVDWSVDTSTGIITASGAGSYDIKAGCQFHVPCRFGEEIDQHLPLSFDAFDIGSIGQIPVVEIKSALENVYANDMGGATRYTTTSNDGSTTQFTHGLAQGRVAFCEAIGADVIELTLPTITNNMPTGAPYFMIFNQGAGGNVVVKEGATTLATIAQDKGIMIGVYIDSGATRKYFTM